MDGTADGLSDAAQVLQDGGCLAVQTDTVFGLAARLDDPAAIRLLFGMKGRAGAKAVAVLVSSFEMASGLGRFSGPGLRLVEQCWPGPLTVVVERQPGLRADLGGDPATIGLRWPRFEPLEALIDLVGPIATTSANLTGEAPLSTPEAIQVAFGAALGGVFCPERPRDDDAGAPAASTVVSLVGATWRLLREGAVPVERIAAILDRNA